MTLATLPLGKPTMTNRWEEISAATAAYHDRYVQDSFSAGQIATSIGNNFAVYIGAPARDSVTYYRFTPGADPEYDTFEPAGNGMVAVTISRDNRWQFGLGVILERSPKTIPRYEFKWPMNLNLPRYPETARETFALFLPVTHWAASHEPNNPLRLSPSYRCTFAKTVWQSSAACSRSAYHPQRHSTRRTSNSRNIRVSPHERSRTRRTLRSYQPIWMRPQHPLVPGHKP
jgi:hypothetical protein